MVVPFSSEGSLAFAPDIGTARDARLALAPDIGAARDERVDATHHDPLWPDPWFTDGLMRAQSALDSTAPILRHLVLGEERALFAEVTMARVRGMVEDLARQLLAALAAVGQATSPPDAAALPDPDQLAGLVPVIAANSPLMSALHALALEWQLAEWLETRHGIDRTLPPLLEAQLARVGEGESSAATLLLAAQARYCQQQRRMQLPLGELPADLFQIALRILHACADDTAEAQGRALIAERSLRLRHDAERSRLALLRRFFDEAPWLLDAGLDIARAGAALFVTALARVGRLPRDEAVLMTSAAHLVRLVLVLRANGMAVPAVRAQAALLHPDSLVPPSLMAIDRLAAQDLLAHAGFAA